MKLKDFQIGQIVYLIERNPKPQDVIREYQVTSVGRKYLNVRCEYNERKFRATDATDDVPYLVEHKEFGVSLLLFSSKEAAQKHIEGNILRNWFIKAAQLYNLNRYTVEQLRAVKEILEPSIKEDD